MLEIKALKFAFDKNPLLTDVCFKVDKGEVVALLGPNGCGKTTVLKLILGLLKPEGGKVSLNGKPVLKERKKIGYVPQYLTTDPTFPVSVEKVVAMGRLGFKEPYKLSLEKSAKALALVDLEDLAKENYGSLSGGLRQRVLIARALVSEPEILLMDEPTANVDSKSVKTLGEILADLKQFVGVLFVTHDVSFVSGVTDKVVCLHGSSSVHKTSEITANLLESVFGTGVHWVDHHHDGGGHTHD